MKLVKSGITRFVILTSNYAIKFPRFTYGWFIFIKGILANLNERDLWEIANIKDSAIANCKQYLCPIVWVSWGGWIVVMKRAINHRDTKWRIYMNVKHNEIRKAFLEVEKLCGDHKEDNYGFINDKPVILDYGTSNIVGKKYVEVKGKKPIMHNV